VARAPPRLHQLAWLFLLLAACRAIELVVLLQFVLYPPTDPILRGLAVATVVIVGVDTLILAFLLILAAGLFLGHRGTFRFVLGNLRSPGLLLLLLAFVSFIFGGLLTTAIAIASIVLTVAVLVVLFNPETRREVEAMGYSRAGVDAAMAVISQRGLHEPVEAPEEDETMGVELVDVHGWLCRECDGYNADEATVCTSCGMARAGGPSSPR